MDIRDLFLLEHIQSIINIGKINTYPKNANKNNCKLVIHKIELQNVLFPLLINKKIFFLTKARINQYNIALYILKNNIKYYSDIPNFINNEYEDILNNDKKILNLKFFND